jgi:hypothetical protein
VRSTRGSRTARRRGCQAADDSQCVKYGVTNCRRISLHVVFCRIYDERNTESQGRYDCQKLVRVALDPITYRVLVTGQGPWQC